jgi:enoyl-CoA hydratase/carnithine racemase
MSGKLAVRKDGLSAWLTIDNPARRNAVSLEMWEAMPDALGELASNEEVRVILVRGAGGKTFASEAVLRR